MSKVFVSFTVLVLSLFVVLVFNSSYSNSRQAQIKELATLTKLPGIAISSSYLENRVIYYEDYSNRLYPQMNRYSKMDYVYAK